MSVSCRGLFHTAETARRTGEVEWLVLPPTEEENSDEPRLRDVRRTKMNVDLLESKREQEQGRATVFCFKS